MQMTTHQDCEKINENERINRKQSAANCHT